MERWTRKAVVLAVGVVIVLTAGCEEENLSNPKRVRLIAAENIRLKKDVQQCEEEIARRDKEIERQKKLHSKETEKQKALLEKCKESKKVLAELAQEGGVEEMMTGFFDGALEENERLSEENKALREEIEKLKKEVDGPGK